VALRGVEDAWGLLGEATWTLEFLAAR